MGLLAACGMYTAIVFATCRLPQSWRFIERLTSAPRPQLFQDSVVGGLVGGVSHILLDSCMHHDMHPLWPFARGNALAGIIGVGPLHIALAAGGFFGLILWLFLREP